MFEAYLNSQQFCERFASIKKGEKVVLLRDREIKGKGKISKGTELIVSTVKLDETVVLPNITETDLQKYDYIIGHEDEVFIYICNVEGLDISFACSRTDIATDDVKYIDETYQENLKDKRKYVRHWTLIGIIPTVVIWFILFPILLLLLIDVVMSVIISVGVVLLWGWVFLDTYCKNRIKCRKKG